MSRHISVTERDFFLKIHIRNKHPPYGIKLYLSSSLNKKKKSAFSDISRVEIDDLYLKPGSISTETNQKLRVARMWSLT